MTANGYKVSFRGDENVSKLDSSGDCITENILKNIQLFWNLKLLGDGAKNLSL